MDALNLRVLEVLNASGKSKTMLAQELDVSGAQLSHIYSGRNKPGVELLQSILKAFPDINAHWLLTGEGAMRQNKANERVVQLESVLKEAIEHIKQLSASHGKLEVKLKSALPD